MIEKTLTAFIEKVNSSSITFKECREYEGEFESQQEATVFPPSAFCEVVRGSNENTNYLNDLLNLRIVLVASHIKGITQNSQGALRMIDTLKSELHDQVLYDDTAPINRLKYTGFEKLINLPGVKVYEINFTADL